MSGFDVIFRSSDEPNAEENWQRLLFFFPQAKRVSGLKGTCNAYRRCADIAEHERFYVVEGDSWILDGFRFRRLPPDLPERVFTWRARNAVNDLVDRNGGIKLISKTIIRSMREDAIDELP